jgi:hypothetical protein
MLEKRDLELIKELREVIKEEVQASETRLEKKIKASATETQNLLLEEMDNLYQKSKVNLEEAIDKVDVIKVSTRYEARFDRLEKRVDELERKRA